MGEIVNLAKRPQKGVRDKISRNLRLPPGYRGDLVVKRRTKEEEESHILRLIQEIADNLGIDVEAPFRRGWRPPS